MLLCQNIWSYNDVGSKLNVTYTDASHAPNEQMFYGQLSDFISRCSSGFQSRTLVALFFINDIPSVISSEHLLTAEDLLLVSDCILLSKLTFLNSVAWEAFKEFEFPVVAETFSANEHKILFYNMTSGIRDPLPKPSVYSEFWGNFRTLLFYCTDLTHPAVLVMWIYCHSLIRFS